MRDYYYKNQWFYLLVAMGFFIYALFFFIQNNNTEKNFIIEHHVITQKRCSAAPRINSFIQVEKKGKTYTVNLPEKECINYSIGDKIKIYYNYKYDYFHLLNRNQAEISRVTISGIAFILLLLPWKYIKGKLSK